MLFSFQSLLIEYINYYYKQSLDLLDEPSFKNFEPTSEVSLINGVGLQQDVLKNGGCLIFYGKIDHVNAHKLHWEI